MNKKIFAAMLLTCVMSASANSYLTMGDSVRIRPVKLDGYSQHQVTMYNEAYCDAWTMSVTYPDGLMVKLVSGITPLDGMTVPYIDRYGADQLYECPLNCSAAYATIGSNITVNGYWDYRGTGEWDSYGTVKWTPGAHSMFEFNFYVDPNFRAGYVIFDGRITSGNDQRGPILQDVRFYKRCWVWVGNMLGDVDSNERVNIGDVTILIEYLLSRDASDLNEFEIAAADTNQDGEVTISDVTVLINNLLRN